MWAEYCLKATDRRSQNLKNSGSQHSAKVDSPLAGLLGGSFLCPVLPEDETPYNLVKAKEEKETATRKQETQLTTWRFHGHELKGNVLQ